MVSKRITFSEITYAAIDEMHKIYNQLQSLPTAANAQIFNGDGELSTHTSLKILRKTTYNLISEQ